MLQIGRAFWCCCGNRCFAAWASVEMAETGQQTQRTTSIHKYAAAMEASAEKERCTTNEIFYAPCPFKVTRIMAVDERLQRRDSAKRGQHEGLLQDSPFKPQGAFKTRRSMSVLYSIEPQDAWFDLSRYRSFVLNDAKHVVGDFVHVDNGSPDNWVAKILEIRASDERHVYARVYWMYSPHDLPAKAGRNRGHAVEHSQFYGRDEMIASNHMDIISVLSIIRGAVVQQTYGEHDDAKSLCLYWRQALDYPTQELSSINAIHEHINQAHESAPSGKVVRDEPPSIPEKQTSQQGRLKEGQQIPTVADEAQLMQIDISNSGRIHRRHRRRCWGRRRKNTGM